jgi:hypothetical protein
MITRFAGVSKHCFGLCYRLAIFADGNGNVGIERERAAKWADPYTPFLAWNTGSGDLLHESRLNGSPPL